MIVHVNDEHDVYIGRPSKWGNPFITGIDGNRDEVIAKHREWVYSNPEMISEIRSELKGKRLACWCHPKSCHGDVLSYIANFDDIFGE
jgi:hypothetical protein